MPRRARLSLPGIPWHIIQWGNNRSVCFHAEEDYYFYIYHLAELAARFGCAIHAYVLMTNHAHLLLTPEKANSVALLMKNLGQRYVQYVNRVYRRSGTLWEGDKGDGRGKGDRLICPNGRKAYFGIAEEMSRLRDIDKWVRRKLRCYLWNQWEPSGYRELRKRGVCVREVWHTSKSAHGQWWLSKTPALTIALPLHGGLPYLQCGGRAPPTPCQCPGARTCTLQDSRLCWPLLETPTASRLAGVRHAIPDEG